jgi:hypothetical protein
LETLDRECTGELSNPYKPKYLTARNIVVIKELYQGWEEQIMRAIIE